MSQAVATAHVVRPGVEWLREQWRGPEALAVAVIVRAYQDAVGCNASDSKGRMSRAAWRRDALRWLFRPQAEEMEFGFQALCDWLGVDGAALQGLVLAQLRQQGVRGEEVA